ncbi:MAG: class I SAM-dependent methyltransferase [Gemmataceae bacterium]
MSRLQERLYDLYSKHYQRVLPETDPRQLRSVERSSLDRSFGHLLRDRRARGPVLDLGCGTGRLLYWLSSYPGIIPVGVDASECQTKVARECLPGFDISCANGLSFLKTRPNAFSGIFCFDVLEHLPGDDLLLEWVEACRSALKSDGFFCCRVPNAGSLIGSFDRYVDLTHQRAFTGSSLLQLLEAAGFSDPSLLGIKEGRAIGRIRAFLGNVLSRSIYFLASGSVPKFSVFTTSVAAVGRVASSDDNGAVQKSNP